VQRQHGGTLAWLAWDPDITVLDSSVTIRGQATAIGGGHLGLPLGFSESSMVWGTSGIYTGQDSEWSEGSFSWDKMDWDLGIEGFFHFRTVQGPRMNQQHIWDLSITDGDRGDQQTKEALVQALLEDKRFLVHWRNLSDEDATWEGEHIREHPVLKLLGDKQHLGGEDCNVPSEIKLLQVFLFYNFGGHGTHLIFGKYLGRKKGAKCFVGIAWGPPT